MSKNKPVIPTTTPNEKRAEAKARKGRGIKAMKKENMTEIQWSQKHDPLFKVKGKERHRRLKEVK